jgi:hypothetical protein
VQANVPGGSGIANEVAVSFSEERVHSSPHSVAERSVVLPSFACRGLWIHLDGHNHNGIFATSTR